MADIQAVSELHQRHGARKIDIVGRNGQHQKVDANELTERRYRTGGQVRLQTGVQT